MKRKTSEVPSKNMLWELLPAVQGGEELRRQLRFGVDYYNRLIRIERDRDEAYRAARTRLCPGFEERESEVKTLDDRRKDINAKLRAARSRSTPPGSIDVEALKREKEQVLDKLDAAKKELKAMRRKLNAAQAPANDEAERRIKERYESTGRKWKGEGVRRDNHAVGRIRSEVFKEMLGEEQWPRFWKVVTRNEIKAHRRALKARHACGLSGGTYLMIEKQVEQAIAAKKKGLVKGNLKYKRWDGSGRVGVQLQGSVTVADVLAGRNSLVQVDPLPTGNWARQRKNGTVCTGVHGMDTRSGRRHAYTKLRMRLCGDGENGKGGKAVMVELPLLLHRLPPPGLVKWAWVQAVRVGFRMRYYLCMTVESREFPRRTFPADGGTVAIDIGWRSMSDGSVRVGYSVDDRGRERDFRVDDSAVIKQGTKRPTPSLMAALRYPDELQSVSKKLFNGTKTTLVAWLKEHSEQLALVERHLQQEDRDRQTERNRRRAIDGDPPDPIEVRSALQYITSWEAHGKLARLVRWWTEQTFSAEGELHSLWTAWKGERLSGKKDLFCPLEELSAWLEPRGERDEVRRMVLWCEWWRRKDRHLVQWEADQRHRSHLRRRELYRVWAVQLASTYAHVVVEDFDMRGVVKRPEPEKDPDGGNNATVRQLVSPSEFRNCVLEAFGPARHSKDDPADSTRCCTTCNYCDDAIEARERVTVVCPEDGTREDQDRRAAVNLLRWHFVGREGHAAERAKNRLKEREERRGKRGSERRGGEKIGTPARTATESAGYGTQEPSPPAGK
jgi:hypothetical protein